ncbi:MAG: LPS export ABC transporter periplasmic protein LptC [Acidobacteriota bacterium]|nr:LPS export ABC transporter periplasmic protein LptC [Acidobacteriota bacterium]
MPEQIQRKNVKNLAFRARMPQIFRALAVLAFAATIIAVVIGFYRAYGYKEFRMKGLPAELSKDVVAEIIGYERRETEGDIIKYYIKADKATTFTDNHQELENVFLQVYDDAGETFDQMTAKKAIYIPAENKNFTAYLAGDVNIETRDALKVKTDQLTYSKATEAANADETIEFSRENVAGKSYGAIVKIREKTLELLKDVEINAYGSEAGEFKNSDFQRAKITAGHAFLNQLAGKIEFDQNVNIFVTPNNNADELAQPTDIKSDRAIALFTNKELKQIDLTGNVDVHQKPTSANAKWTKTKANRAVAQIDKELKQLELFENVTIETTANDAKPTKIKTNYALFQKDADRFELKNGVEIVTVDDNQPTTIKSNDAIYEQTNGKIFLFGNAEITQGNNYLKGDNLRAQLFPNKKLQNAFVKGNAFLKQVTNERMTEVSGDELNAIFGNDQLLQNANVIGATNTVLIPVNSPEYSKVSLSAPNSVKLNFQAGLLNQMQTDGRTTILMNAPQGKSDAANKKLTADSVKTVFNAGGKDLAKAEAVGNAELFIEPLIAAPANYKTTINAPRFDCDFFETGNNAKNCSATGKSKIVRVPTVKSENRGSQILLADKLIASFNQQTQDVQQFDAVGNTKFTELDRNGIAGNITFTASDEVVRLRGEPTVFDSRARAKASEIDWDTRGEKSFLRGNVSTTYYSQKQTNGATPFSNVSSPVFITALNANFDHKSEVATYMGNARAWQENNYVRADTLVLQQKQGQLYGEGAVQSLLYDAKKKENGKEVTVPVFASANKLFYEKDKNLLRYEGNVDIRQGMDRIVAGVASVILNSQNEVSNTVAENNVVITQPNRKAVGDYAQYTAADEKVILRGNPAKIEDTENGSSQGAQMTVFLREKRIVSESKTEQNSTGRIRTVYKIKNQ